jgi:N-acetylglutamate synthase-like GNAT family acetyltransferase
MNIICKQWAVDFEVNGYHIEDILSLIKEAYRERAKEGISFATLSYTIDDFLAERTDGDYWFLAFDEDCRLCGTLRLTVNGNWGETCNMAVLPNCQGKHVGSLLFQAANSFAKEQKLDHVISYTATHAISSVKCHCNNGFRIVGINIGLHTDYSSYVFRNQLTPSYYWNSAVLMKLRTLWPYLLFRVTKKTDGKNTILGNMLLFLKGKLFSEK